MKAQGGMKGIFGKWGGCCNRDVIEMGLQEC